MGIAPQAVSWSWDEGRHSTDPDGGGHVPPDLDGDREAATDRRHLQGAPAIVLPAPVGPQSPGSTSRALLSIWRRERERIGADRVTEELALRHFRETAPGGTGERFLEDRPKSFSSSDLRGGGGYRRRGSAGAWSAEGTLSDPAEQVSGQHHSQGGDGARIMPLGANAANHAAGSLAVPRGLVVQDYRLGLRGKNDSARPPGIHKPRCIT